MSESTALVAVVSGSAYEAFARDMFESAREHFKPTETVKHVQIIGVDGWPNATMSRPLLLARWLGASTAQEFDYVFLIDADARFEQHVGAEVLPRDHRGITATLHPGYVDRTRAEFPYERRVDHSCCVGEDEGEHYFCGGFIGGGRVALRQMMAKSSKLILRDTDHGRVPQWHDESANNRVLIDSPPQVILDPSYAHPDQDGYYVKIVWGKELPRRIVMLDKPAEVRGSR